MPYFTNRGITPLPVGGGGGPGGLTTAFWYDASDAATFTLSGSDVTEWRDKSGNSRHLTPTGPFSSVLQASVKNGLSGVLLGADASNGSVLTTTSTFSFSQAHTIVAAIKIGDGSAFQQLTNTATLCMNTAATAAALISRSNTASNHAVIYAGTFTPVDTGVVLSASTAYTFYGQFNGASSVAGVNGTPGSSADAGVNGISSTNFQLGRDGAGVAWAGHVLELFGFSGVNGADLTAALSYITGKWGSF